MTFPKKSNLLNQLIKNRFKKSKIKFKINPKGKMVLLPFILYPSYQDITLVRTQIRWCEETAWHYLKEDFDYFLFKKNVELADSPRKELKKLAR
jgi:hypothetical protein